MAMTAPAAAARSTGARLRVPGSPWPPRYRSVAGRTMRPIPASASRSRTHRWSIRGHGCQGRDVADGDAALHAGCDGPLDDQIDERRVGVVAEVEVEIDRCAVTLRHPEHEVQVTNRVAVRVGAAADDREPVPECGVHMPAPSTESSRPCCGKATSSRVQRSDSSAARRRWRSTRLSPGPGADLDVRASCDDPVAHQGVESPAGVGLDLVQRGGTAVVLDGSDGGGERRGRSTFAGQVRLVEVHVSVDESRHDDGPADEEVVDPRGRGRRAG